MNATRQYPTEPLTDEEPQRRGIAEMLTLRAPLLAGEDRLLMSLYLEDGHSYRQIARLIGANPSTVARRIRKIAQRLIDETYSVCLENKSAFSRPELAIVRDYFLRGLSFAQIGRKHGTSYYRARTTVLKARKLVAAATPPSEPRDEEVNCS
jgi:transposase